jgi:CheY-like chemotaxis protein
VNVEQESNGHRVLVVDDEPHIADVIAMALRWRGSP